MLSQLSGQMGQLADQTWTANLPLLNNLNLAQTADLAQAFQNAVTDRISLWSTTLHRQVSQFSTAQELVNLLADVLDVTPATIGVRFVPTTNLLTFHLALTAHPFSDLLAQTLQLNLNQGGLANAGISSSQLKFSSTVTANLIFGIDLTPLNRG